MNSNASSLCHAIDDAQFGPAVSSQCRGAFDFTLYFEQLVLIAVPGAVLLAAAPFRVYRLKKAPILVRPSRLRNAKLAAVTVLGSLQLALVSLWAVHGTGSARLDRVSIAAACISVASSIACCAVSYYEHAKSLRPSSLLNVFLMLSLVLDCAVTRTLWMSSLDLAIRILFSVALATKAMLVVLEAQGKQKSFIADAKTMPPEETAGLYSRVVLAWVLPLLRAGFGKLLRPRDLFALDDKMTAQLLSEKFRKAWECSSHVAKHRLIWTCAVALKGSAAAVVLPRVVQLGFTICQPLALTRFLSFLGNQNDFDNVGYGLTAAYGIIYFGIALSQALYWHYNARSVSMLRSVLVTSVFSKMTTLYTTESEKSAAVTLMSSDVEVIVRAAREIHELWANIIQIAIGTWLLAREVGYAAVGPILVSGIALGATLKISPMARNAMVNWLQKTQKRVGITSAMIGHMKSIKMSGLATTLSDSIAALRREEIDASKPFRIFGSLTSSIAQIPVLLSPVAAFGIFQAVSAQTGAQLDAQRLFTALALITLQAQPLFWMFELVLNLTVAKGAFHRIETFLLRNERPENRQLAATTDNISFKLSNMSFSWIVGEPQIANATFQIGTGQLAMIVGPTASGKSTLLKGLLGEVPHASGDLQTNDRKMRVSLCDQATWVTNQTIRENIVGYAQFDEEMYNLVIEACELRYDFRGLKDGDNTVVGSNGIALSGGQKQRLAIARALYHRPEIALFDDVLSALDNETASAVVSKVFGPQGLLRRWNTTAVLVTHKAAILPLSDVIISLADRSVAEVGTFSSLSQAGGYVQNLAVAAGTNTAQLIETSQDRQEAAKTNPRASAAKVSGLESNDKRRQRGDPAVYKYYGKSIGLKALATLLLLEVGWAFLQSFPTVWLNFWNDSIGRSENRTGYYLGIYAALQTVAVVWFALLIWFVLVQVAARSGIYLHGNLLRAVVNAPFSVFVKSDIGSMTTRFSQDIGILDNQLPLALVVSLASFFTVLARTGLLAASSYYVAIAFPFLAVAYYYLQRSYLRTSRQLRLLDLEQKSPIYTQFIETASGLSTIRAFNWVSAAVQKNHELVDESQKPFYLLIIVQKWLVLALDMMTASLALLVVGFAVYLRGSVSVGLTGVSLVQLISMSETLTMLIQFWTSIETSIGAVARIKNFAEESGDERSPSEAGTVPPTWPQTGAIAISHISASYNIDNATKALDDVSIEIKGGEKIALCGRTGSGKSSILLAVLRLLELSQGSIQIDGVDLGTIPRDTVRRRLITVSQDQFVLPGSVKHNLDPEGVHTPDSIMEALRNVGLSETIEAKGGLETEMGEDILSHGQKQLFFLARAVLKKDCGRVVLLDEASSNLDSATAERTRDIVATEFSHHTVISIAHRLDTIMDYDRVVVLENGAIVETGVPRALLESATKFRDLYHGKYRQ